MSVAPLGYGWVSVQLTVSRIAQMVLLLIPATSLRERIQRRRVATMTNMPEQRRSPMTSFLNEVLVFYLLSTRLSGRNDTYRRMGILTFINNGRGMATRTASVLDKWGQIRCKDGRRR
jgi:hypothetical protein